MGKNLVKGVTLVLCLLLAACAGTPGQQKKPVEMVREEKVLNQDYQVVYKNFLTGFEVCASGSLFIPDPIGFPECSADLNGKIMQCTIYHSQVVGPRADRVLGVVTIKSSGTGTALVQTGYNPEFAKKESSDYWMRFAEGNYQCR